MREEGFISGEFLMAQNDLSVVSEPGMSLESSFVTRNSDSNFRLDSPPPEEPGEDQGFFEASCCDGGVSASDLHQPSQTWDRGNQPQGGLPLRVQEHFLREAEEPCERQDSQGGFNKEKESPGLNKDGSFARRKLKNLMYTSYC